MEDIDERSFRASFFFSSFLAHLERKESMGRVWRKKREKEEEGEVGQREEKIEMGIRG